MWRGLIVFESEATLKSWGEVQPLICTCKRLIPSAPRQRDLDATSVAPSIFAMLDPANEHPVLTSRSGRSGGMTS